MNKFYLENIVEKLVGEDASEVIKSLREFDTETEAEIAFHNEVSYPTLFDDTLFVRCTVIGSQGNPVTGLSEIWKKKVPTPQEGEEPVVYPDAEKYFLTLIKLQVDGTVIPEIFDYDTPEEGIYQFHHRLSEDMDNPLYVALTSRLTDKNGSEVHKTRY